MTSFTLTSSKPQNLTPLAQRVFDTLAKYTAFPWPVMAAQCHRAGVDPSALSPDALVKVIDFIADGIGKYTSPEKGAAVKTELLVFAK